MAMYQFNKSPCATDRLDQEIRGSAITVALDYINSVSGIIYIYFKAALSESEQALLSSIVTAHTGVPLPDAQEVVIAADNSIQKDTDGATLARAKITQTGWGYQLHSVEVETSTLNSIYSKKADGNNFGYSTLKFYDENNLELTTQESIDSSCVKTVMDWEPDHSYEIIGGVLKQIQTPLSDIRIWIVGVPDVPANYGGSKEFVTGGLNLRYLNDQDGVNADGRAPKKLDPSVAHTNKMRLIVRHNAGVKHKMMMLFEIFKA